MTVTLKDIAQKAGVSISSVSRVLNNDQTRSVSKETEDMIWKIAHEMGYSKSKKARAKKSKKQKRAIQRIGYILCKVPDKYNHPYFSEILQGIELEAKTRGIYIEFAHTEEELQEPAILHRALNNESVDGVILVEPYDTETLNYLKNRYKYIVGIGLTSVDDIDSVLVDKKAATINAIQHLIDLGHKRIGFIGGTGNKFSLVLNNHLTGAIQNNEERFIGYIDALRNSNIEIDQSIIISSEWSSESAYECMKEFLSKKDLNMPDAFFVASDLLALGAMKAIKEKGMTIPEDIAIVSYDNIDMAEFADPALTTVNVKKSELGRIAVKTLVDRGNGELFSPVKIVLPTRLIIRESCGYKK